MSEENKAPETTPEQPQPSATDAETVKPETVKSETEAPKAEAPKAEAPKAEAPKPAAAKPAPAAKPAAKEAEPAPPDPRAIAAAEKANFYKTKIVALFGDSAVETAEAKKFLPTLLINRDHWVEVVDFMKTEPTLAFTYAECMAGTDYKDYIEVFLYLHSFELDTDVALKVRTPRDNASIPSVANIFNGVNWEEREIYDLLGVDFPGHPNMKRIMLPDEWHGHPLRKDYVVQD